VTFLDAWRIPGCCLDVLEVLAIIGTGRIWELPAYNFTNVKCEISVGTASMQEPGQSGALDPRHRHAQGESGKTR